MQRITLSSLIAAAAMATLAGAAHAAPATYAIDPAHTFVTFEVHHFGTSTVRGRFDKKQGSVTIDPQAKTGKAEIVIDTPSLSSGVPPFDAHLKSADFFNVEAFPTATFKGDQFRFEGDKVTEVAGTLTLLGKTQPVTLKATNYNCYENPRLKRQVCGGDFETTIQRSAWGMNFGVPNIPDAVHLLVQIEAIKQ